MKSWYIRNNDEHLGPYSLDELRLLGVYSDDYVWKEGLPKWIKAHTVPELKETLIHVDTPYIPEEIKKNATSLDDCPSLDKLNRINAGFSKIFGGKKIASLFRRSNQRSA